MEEYEELLQEQRDKLFEEMLERYPILKDPDFITHFPEIKEVALHIYSVTRDEKLADIQKRFPIFYSMELTNLEGYLNLLRQGNPKVIKDYEQLEKKLVNSEKQL